MKTTCHNCHYLRHDGEFICKRYDIRGISYRDVVEENVPRRCLHYWVNLILSNRVGLNEKQKIK